MYKAVIFDFFDVIRTDPYKAWLKRHNIERTGRYSEISRLLDRGDIGLEEFFSRLSALSGYPAHTLKHEYENTKLVDKKLFHLIEVLRKTYEIGLLSNAPCKYLRGLLTEHDYAKFFDVIVISSEVQLIKPTARAFHHILKKLDTNPEEAVFIDDSEHNVEAAQQCGITTIHFTGVRALTSELAKLGLAVK